MKNIFLNACRAVGKSERGSEIFAKILAEYQKPNRFYHTFEGHIAFCIQEAIAIPLGLIQNKDAAIIALFLHDAVMNFSGREDKELNAKFASDVCQEMKTTDSFGNLVVELVRATYHGQNTSKNKTALFVADIDLAIFGQNQSIFDEYEKNIRLEYASAPENIFKNKRIAILQKFLNRPSVYSTKYFQEKYEHQARKNLVHSINKLKQ